MTQETSFTGSTSSEQKYIIINIADQKFCMLIDLVEDILLPQKINPVPLSPSYILGSLNLRGRVVTAIDLRVKLGIKPLSDYDHHRSVVVAYMGELFSLVVDSVSEIINIPNSAIERSPENLSQEWRELSSGIYMTEEQLITILDVKKILNMDRLIVNKN